MTNEEILKKAVEKAVKNGYKSFTDLSHIGTYDGSFGTSLRVFAKHKDGPYARDGETIIFSHDFAKAFWGTERKTKGKWFIGEMWQLHLREMVLEEEPLKYIEKFL